MKQLAALAIAVLVLGLPSAAHGQAPTSSSGGWDPAAPPDPTPPPDAREPAAYAPPAYPAPPPGTTPGYPAPAYPMAPQKPPRTRGAWYIGFGLGGGGGSVTDLDGTASLKEFVGPKPTTLAMNFRVGATLSPRLLLGFDGGFVATASGEGEDTSIQVNTYDLAATFFPLGSGPYLKAGTGVSTLVLDQGSFGTGSWRGYNVMGGVGYAWWVGRTFNLTFNLEGTKAWYGSSGLDSTQAWSLFLGFDWY
jgi:hypothetical protein